MDKLRNAIAFSYDRVNARVAVTALFPEPICIRAVISYLEQKLPNGDFDIIVLSSKSLTEYLVESNYTTVSFSLQVVTPHWCIKILLHANTTFAMKPDS